MADNVGMSTPAPATTKAPIGSLRTLWPFVRVHRGLFVAWLAALAISSTDCRERQAAGDPVWYLVPDGVVQYINKHDLYRKHDGTENSPRLGTNLI